MKPRISVCKPSMIDMMEKNPTLPYHQHHQINQVRMALGFVTAKKEKPDST